MNFLLLLSYVKILWTWNQQKIRKERLNKKVNSNVKIYKLNILRYENKIKKEMPNSSNFHLKIYGIKQ